ncbi:MAG: UDP-N-acetylmuramoyl-tripeptide--D-alanyl-D-alanine ligase [Gammaproteobacteria bacterium]
MIRMRLSQAAQSIDATLSGDDVEFRGVSTDTRNLQADNLFVALLGPHFDAHEFLAQAQAQGAVAAMLNNTAPPTLLPTLRVADTRTSLARLAASWRQQFTLPVIAVTGSNGKTTVKEMLAAIFNQVGPTLVTQGNLNNDIGLPLTLLRLDATHRFAVIEMGANHPGDIAYLTDITQPTVALINNAGPAHLEGFINVEGVARGKGEIFMGLDAQGTAIINADDVFSGLWHELIGTHRYLSFGLENSADVSAQWKLQDSGTHVQIRTPAGGININLALPGRHNVMNALAASAAALAAGAALADIKRGLEAVQPVKGRLQIKPGLHNSRIIDDTYNANPGSLKAALEVLADEPASKWLVLGDMAELGDNTRTMHEVAGEQARALNIDRLFAVGELSRFAVQSFAPAGTNARHFATQCELIVALQDALAATLPDKVSVLVKGSRSAGMEYVVAALAPPPAGTD